VKLPEHAILRVEVGSTAHGTGLPGGEDHDETVVVLETPEQVFWSPLPNRMDRTQPEGTRSGPGDTDRNVYSARSFLHLAAAGNPSVLLCFWAPTLPGTTEEGGGLRALAPHLVGRHVVPRYRGYMRAQCLRMFGARGGGHGTRGGGQRTELVEAHGYDTKFAMHVARLGFQGEELCLTGELQLPVAGEPGDWLRAVRRGEVPLEEWWARVLDLEARLERLERSPLLPDGPNLAPLARWLDDVHRRFWTYLDETEAYYRGG